MKMYKKGILILVGVGSAALIESFLSSLLQWNPLNIPLCGGDFIAKASASLFQNDSIGFALTVDCGRN
ncbi:hypothetical protein [Paenibacillus nuruki]|uniref:hypothetical protein n=1 Tax=Paenibacillus nuruki TaxID=1886670 RepID=UPI002805A6EB|nr:hypothetical protein [Paenibacillus nuruki]